MLASLAPTLAAVVQPKLRCLRVGWLVEWLLARIWLLRWVVQILERYPRARAVLFFGTITKYVIVGLVLLWCALGREGTRETAERARVREGSASDASRPRAVCHTSPSTDRDWLLNGTAPQRTGHTFLPPRVAFLRTSCALNDEIGRSHTLLPVASGAPRPELARVVAHAHDRSAQLTRGVWLSYARGCSDVLWDSGRSLVAPNRLEAALRVAMLDAGCDLDCAVRAVQSALWSASSTARHSRAVQVATTAAATAEGGAGAVDGDDTNATRRWRQLGADIRRAHALEDKCPSGAKVARADQLLLSRLSGADALSKMLGAGLRQHGFDSAQLLFQPAGEPGFPRRWSTELWDVRRDAASDLVERGGAGRAGEAGARERASFVASLSCGGQACRPTPSFRQCIGCDGCASGCD